MAPSASSSRLPADTRKRAAPPLLDSDGEEIEVFGAPSKKAARSDVHREVKAGTAAKSPSSSSTKPVHSFFSKPGSSSSAAGTSVERIEWRPSLGPARSCLVGEFKDALRTVARSSKSSPSKKQKIAAFDLDGNLIETSSGRAAYNFVDENDFRIWGRTPKERTAVRTKLQEEYRAGSLILVLTNQLNLDQKAARLKIWKARLGLILRQLDVPAVIFAGTRRDAYRKPGAGWIEELREMWSGAGGIKELDINPGVPVEQSDEATSFFVGDAAGRTAVGKNARDFADTDRKLAHNLGWRFLTPEEYFAGEETAAFEWSGHRPATPPAAGSGSSSSKARLQDLRGRMLESTSAASKPTLLILVGPQASGKSFFAKRLEAEGAGRWVRVNQDTLKTKEKCLKTAEEALKAGKSVIVDNTNPARATRALYTSLAKRYDLHKRVCVHFDITLQEAQHNDAFRSKRWLFPPLPASTKPREALPVPMPSIAFNSYYKALEKPQVGEEEGFDEVLRVGFEFEGDEEELKAWRLWYS